MKSILFAAAMAACTFPVTAADMGLSISVGQPGFFGRIDIANTPRPRLLYPRPVVVSPVLYFGLTPAPIYLHVPPWQARHWRYYCNRYRACSRPVYFVQDDWYNHVYVPRYYDRTHGRYNHDRDHGRDRYREHDRDRHHDDDRNHDRYHHDSHDHD